jgi:hypothetical protein
MIGGAFVVPVIDKQSFAARKPTGFNVPPPVSHHETGSQVNL